MEEENKREIWHKIMPNHKYRIWRKDYNGQTFYNIQVTQRNYNADDSKYYIPVTFKKGVEIPNETDIIIIKAIENLRENKNVDEKYKSYYPIHSYMITEYEIVERQEQIEQKAYDDFRNNLNEIEANVEITDDMLPF